LQVRRQIGGQCRAIQPPPVWSEVALIQEQRNISRMVETAFAISMRQYRSIERVGSSRRIIGVP
jgi:hypothetical protein